jgi:hypothetical protein
MPGWANYSVSTTPVAACEVGYALGSIDSARVVEEIFPEDLATNGWLKAKLTAAGEEDTAKGNVVILDANIPDLSAAKKLTLKVFNTNQMSGIWFTVAFLTGAPDWAWAQPEGCWVNAGEETLCEIDLTTTAKDQVVLEGDDYTAFMSNISKVYLEIFAAGFNGTVYYDDVTVDGTIVINDFNTAQKIKVEEGSFITAEVVGNGN